MISPPEVITTEPQLYASIPVRIPREQIREVMGPTLQEIFGALAAQGLVPMGAWFTHHFHRPTEVFDFEVCVPVSRAVKAEGRLQAGTWPALRVARAIYSGPYEGLAEAWPKLMDWMEAQKLEAAEDLWERYLVGPETSPNPEDWRTELCRPLAGAQ